MKQFLLALVAVAALSSVLLYNYNSENIKKQTLDGIVGGSPIVTYIYNSTVNSKQYVSQQDQAEENVVVNVSAACQLMINHTVAKKQYSVYVSYDNFDVKKLQMEDGKPIDDSYFTQQDEGEDQILYWAILNDQTGQLLSLQVPQAISLDYSDLMKFVTIDILRLAFPQIRKYVNSEFSEYEEHSMGRVQPHYMTSVNGELLVVKKWFDEEDFLSMKYDLGAQRPDIDFVQTTTIDTKTNRVISSKEQTGFVAATNVQYQVVRREDGEYDTEPIVLQNADVQQETTFDLLKTEYDQSRFEEIQEYISQTPYMEISITHDGEAKIYDDQSDVPIHVIDNTDPVYHFDYTIVSMSMLKQSFGIKAAYDNYGTYSKMLAYVFVNTKNIKTLYSISYQHCPGKTRDTDHSYNAGIPLFTVKWPILAILSIQFSASMNLNYGWKWYYGPDDVMTGCLIKFMPYYNANLQASGAVSIKIAKAGMYAKGSIAQSYLSF